MNAGYQHLNQAEGAAANPIKPVGSQHGLAYQRCGIAEGDLVEFLRTSGSCEHPGIFRLLYAP